MIRDRPNVRQKGSAFFGDFFKNFVKIHEKWESKHGPETTFQERVFDEKKSGNSCMSPLSIGENAGSNAILIGILRSHFDFVSIPDFSTKYAKIMIFLNAERSAERSAIGFSHNFTKSYKMT